MASGYRVNTAELDGIFAPYASGAKPAATGYRVAGVDLIDRYQPYSGGPKAPATGFKVVGVDLSDIFTPAVALGSHTITWASTFSLQGIAGLRVLNTGALQKREGDTYTDFLGEWLNSGAAADYEARASSLTGSGGTFNGTVDVWLDCAGSPEWYLRDVDGTVGVESDRHFLLELRRKVGGIVVASGVIDLFADYTAE